jgi:predicted dehydrogenase
MRLLILGTGGMADKHAEFFGEIEGVMLVAGVDTDPERLRAFCSKHKIANRFASLEDAIAWDDFDAVANVTPDGAHYATTLAALRAKKHVFCEKPLSTDYARALEMTEAAEMSGLVGMVNLTYRNVAQLQRARELVLAGAIGNVRHVEASYLQSWLVSQLWGDWHTDSKWLWRLSRKHGSNGVLGDVGIHILDFAAYGAGADIARIFCRLRAFDKAPNNRIGEYDLDANDSFSMTVDFSNGALGVVHASRWATGHINDLRLRIYGDKGSLEVLHQPERSKLMTCLGEDIENGIWREERVVPVPTNYQRFVEAVRQGKTLEPSFRQATKLQKVLDEALVTESDRQEHAV